MLGRAGHASPVHGDGRRRLRPHRSSRSEPFAEAVVVLDHTGTATLRRQRRVRRRRRRAARPSSRVQDWDDDAVHVAQHARPASAATPRFKHVVVTLGGDLVRLVTDGRVRRPRRRRRAVRPVLRRRRPAPGAPAAGRPRRAALPQPRRLQGRAAGRGRAHGLDRRRAHPRRGRPAPTPTSSTATWCSPTAPAPTRCPTWRSRPARSSAPATPAPPAASTTSSCSTCMARGIPADEARRLVVRGFFAELRRSRSASPSCEERLLARDRGRAGEAVRRELADVPARVRAAPSWPRTPPIAGRARRRRRSRVVSTEGEVFAIYDICSHAEVSLSEGEVEDGTDRVLAARLALRPAHRQADRPARHRARPRLPREDRGRRRARLPSKES